MNVDNLSPQEIFFRFASVCLEGKLMKHEIDKKECDKVLEEYSKNRIVPSREWLAKTFYDAIRRMNEEAEGKEIWTKEFMIKYWGPNGGHNRALEKEYLSEGELGKKHIEICSTYSGEVMLENGERYKLRFDDGRERLVDKMYVRDAKPGDRIVVHRWKTIVYDGEKK